MAVVATQVAMVEAAEAIIEVEAAEIIKVAVVAKVAQAEEMAVEVAITQATILMKNGLP